MDLAEALDTLEEMAAEHTARANLTTARRDHHQRRASALLLAVEMLAAAEKPEKPEGRRPGLMEQAGVSPVSYS